MTAGAWKLAVTMQGDTTNLVDVEFYTNGSTYFDYGGQANLSTGTNDYGASITSIGGSAWRLRENPHLPRQHDHHASQAASDARSQNILLRFQW